MDKSGGLGFDDANLSVRKKRSIRPRLSQHPSPSDDSPCYDHSSLASTPLSDGMSKASSEENASHGSFISENVNHSVSGGSETNLSEAGNVGKPKDEAVVRVGESNEASAGKLTKVKLKVGGVTHTLHARTSSQGSSLPASSEAMSLNPADSLPAQHMPISEDCPGDGHYVSKDRESRLRGIPWKDFSKSGFTVKKHSTVERMPEQGISPDQFGNYDLSRKSKRVHKGQLVAEDFDDGENSSDDEIRFLEKIRAMRHASNYVAEDEGIDEEGSKKQRSLSGVIHSELYGNDVDKHNNSFTSDKESRRVRSIQASEDTEYFQDEELLSDDEPELMKKRTKDLIDTPGVSKGKTAITTRRRMLKIGRGHSSLSNASLIEFPNGLPPAPPKKQKEKLTKDEQQIKKAEAAQKRRIQHEKAAREAEAEAIRKIMGQDSSRKKLEKNIKRRNEERAQEMATNKAPSSNSVRWVIGPSGTTVTFPNELGLPSILESKPLSYPPPRENCAGPSCTNAYKYRDARSKLPLCSLGCYKAVHEKMQNVASCSI